MRLIARFSDRLPSSLRRNDQEATVYHDLTFAVTNGITIIDGMNTFLAEVTDAGVTRSNRLQMFLPQYVNLSYDLNGNLLSDGQHGYEYDCANQLTRITVTNRWKSEFGYDGFGRRRVRKEYAWMPGAANWQLTNEVHYVYRGMTVLQERAGNNMPLVTYTRGLDLSGTKENAGGIGGLLARTDGSGSAFYHSDGNGNITALINSSGVVQAHYLYDPYGNLLAKSGPLAEANVYRFSSKEYDRNAGLYYYGFRYYEPNFQRWLNRDPIGEVGGLSLYCYVGNNPLNLVDPYGEDAYTIGPVTIPIPGTTEWWEQDSQSAHEGQHRADWLKSIPGWRKEQRGFAAEIPVIDDQLRRYQSLLDWMKNRSCRDKKMEQNLQDAINKLNSALKVAQDIGNNDESAMDYWNDAARRWYQSPVSPPRPLPPGYMPPPSNVNRNAPPPIH